MKRCENAGEGFAQGLRKGLCQNLAVGEAPDKEATAEGEDELPALAFEVETEDRLLFVERTIPNTRWDP